jgi:fructose-1,6-bisphosphatase/inositol monophosphatase family enzyme
LQPLRCIFLSEDRRLDIAARSAGVLQMVPIPRCAGEQYPRVVLGQNDIALFERTLPWDHVAGCLFLREAGGIAARPDGSAYRVDRAGTGLIAAATPQLWDRAVEVLFR